MNNSTGNKKQLSPKQPRSKRFALQRGRREELLRTLKARFEEHLNRHKGLEWAKVQARLEANAEKLWSLNEMERTGGEPDVVGHDKKTGEYTLLIVHRKVLKAAPVFVTTVKGWIRGKNLNRKILPLIWRSPWALSF